MTTQEAVVCCGVTKEFGSNGTRTQVLRGIDWRVRFGEMTLLVGPSGCGKTTLISVIAGLLNPTEGALTVLEVDMSRLRGQKAIEFRRHNLGFVFQQFNLLPALTAAQNAAVPLLAAGMRTKDAVAKA